MKTEEFKKIAEILRDFYVQVPSFQRSLIKGIIISLSFYFNTIDNKEFSSTKFKKYCGLENNK